MSAPAAWERLRGARIFLTGGTGFVGSWLIESFTQADREWGLRARLTVLTRDAARFRSRHPELASCEALSFHAGDVRDFGFPQGPFTHVIHAAAPTDERQPPEQVKDVIVEGSRRVLSFARAAGVSRLILVSSGAVYGRQETSRVCEDDPGLSRPLEPSSAYAEGKRLAERLCLQAAGFEAVIARGFAFVGPRLPLDARFAVGNFIADALRGRPIEVKGDGAPLRSYLYASDMAAWLWTLLVQGAPGRAYNVGSERELTVAELAKKVAAVVAPGLEVRVAGQPRPGHPTPRYIPDTTRARTELGLRETVSLEEAIRKTADWARAAAIGGAAS